MLAHGWTMHVESVPLVVLGGRSILSYVTRLVRTMMLQTVSLNVFVLFLTSLLNLANFCIDPCFLQAQVITHFLPA